MNRKKERSLKNEDSLRDFWNNIKFTNIHTIGVPDKRKNGKKSFEEIITENFFNEEDDIQAQEAQSPKQDKPKEDHIKIHN